MNIKMTEVKGEKMENENIISGENADAGKIAVGIAPAAGPGDVKQGEFTPQPKPVKKPAFATNSRDIIFALLFTMGTFLGISWGLMGGLRLGFAIAHAAALIVGTVYFAKRGGRPGVFGAVCGAVSLLLALPFAVTSNEVIRMLSGFAAVVLELLWFASLAGRRPDDGDLGAVKLVPAIVLRGAADMPAVMGSLFSSENNKNKSTAKAAGGVLCALPVLCVIISLLIKSDAAFEGLMSSLIADPSMLLLQGILTAIAAPFIVSFAVSLKYRPAKQKAKQREGRGIDTAFLTAFLGVISLCYLVYMLSQLAYFFSAFSGILPEGYEFTYAGYARRGFFELCAIAGINLVLIFAAIIFSKKKSTGLPGVLRGFGCFIGVFTLALIATALSKMVMYINNFGMTVLRVGTGVFMLIIAFVFVCVIIRCFTEKIKVIELAAIAAGLALTVLGTANLNAVAANYNYSAYADGRLKTVDVNYLYELGDEGVPYLVKLLGDEKYGEQAKYMLTNEAAMMYEFEQTFEDEFVPVYFMVETYHFKPENKTYKKFCESGVSLRAAYAALDAFIKDNPDGIIIDHSKLPEEE